MGAGAWSCPEQRSWRDGTCAEDTQDWRPCKCSSPQTLGRFPVSWGLRAGDVCLKGNELIPRQWPFSPGQAMELWGN